MQCSAHSTASVTCALFYSCFYKVFQLILSCGRGFSPAYACRLEKRADGSIDFYYQGPDGQVNSMNCGLVLFGTGRKPIVWDMGLEVTSIYTCMYVFGLYVWHC